MGRISVLGGSVAGLYTALTLARDGHDVTVYERDPAPPADLADAIGSWERPGTPQLRQSHSFLARAVRLLKDDHPDLHGALRDLGAREIRLPDYLPPWIEDRAPRDGDDDLVVLCARRPVFDWALHAYAAASGVRVEHAAVAGLAFAGDGALPHVTGVRLADGTAREADVVVDASGRRTRTPKWLADAGVAPLPEESLPCGNHYWTRYYALREGVAPPRMQRGFGGLSELDAATALVFQGDGDTFSVTFQTEDTDAALRGLRDPRGFAAAAAAVPLTAEWTDPEMSRPLNDPAAMAGLHNLMRRTVSDGRPLVTGLLLAGDATATSNPTYGRGVSLAMVSAHLLREALAHSDPGDAVLAYDEGLSREVEPYIRNSREVDARTLARWRRALYGEPVPPRPEGLVYEDVALGAMRDREVYTPFVEASMLLRTPDILQSDPDVVERVAAVRASGFAMPPRTGTTRDDVAAAVAAATG